MASSSSSSSSNPVPALIRQVNDPEQKISALKALREIAETGNLSAQEALGFIDSGFMYDNPDRLITPFSAYPRDYQMYYDNPSMFDHNLPPHIKTFYYNVDRMWDYLCDCPEFFPTTESENWYEKASEQKSEEAKAFFRFQEFRSDPTNVIAQEAALVWLQHAIEKNSNPQVHFYLAITMSVNRFSMDNILAHLEISASTGFAQAKFLLALYSNTPENLSSLSLKRFPAALLALHIPPSELNDDYEYDPDFDSTFPLVKYEGLCAAIESVKANYYELINARPFADNAQVMTKTYIAYSDAAHFGHPQALIFRLGNATYQNTPDYFEFSYLLTQTGQPEEVKITRNNLLVEYKKHAKNRVFGKLNPLDIVYARMAFSSQNSIDKSLQTKFNDLALKKPNKFYNLIIKAHFSSYDVFSCLAPSSEQAVYNAYVQTISRTISKKYKKTFIPTGVIGIITEYTNDVPFIVNVAAPTHWLAFYNSINKGVAQYKLIVRPEEEKGNYAQPLVDELNQQKPLLNDNNIRSTLFYVRRAQSLIDAVNQTKSRISTAIARGLFIKSRFDETVDPSVAEVRKNMSLLKTLSNKRYLKKI